MPNDRRKILKAIKREGRHIKDPHARRVYEKSAVETGIVESNLTNVVGGDSDSSNWRQERASGYGTKWAQTGGSQNIDASVRRYRQEFQAQYQPGQKSYEASANIQRPREDLRGRYHDVAGQASQVLKGAKGIQPNTREGSSGPSYKTTPGVDNSDARMQARQAYALGNMHDPNALLTLASSLRQAQDTPSTTTKIKAKPYQGGTSNKTGSALADAAKAEADTINQAHVSYQWGGGHGGKQARGSKVTPLDCSGAVSRVLGIDPRVSGEFEKWGKPGRGKVTVYSNQHHVLMEINNHFFGTSASNPGGGAGWIPRKQISKEYLRGFTARHA